MGLPQRGINRNNIDDREIVTTRIALQAVTAAEIQLLTITAAQIANLTITAAQIANLTITAAKIAALTITAAEIANLTITGGKIAPATITEDKMVLAPIPKCTSNRLYGSLGLPLNPNSAALGGFGILHGSNVTGTVTDANVAATGKRRKNFATAAALNSDAGFINVSFTQFELRQNPLLIINFALVDLIDVRFWAGLFAAGSMALDSGLAAFGCAAVHFQPGVSANFRAYNCDGAAAEAFNEFGAGVPADAADHQIIIETNDAGANVTISLDGAPVVVPLAAGLPLGNTGINLILGIRTIGAAGVKNFGHYNVEMEIDNI